MQQIGDRIVIHPNLLKDFKSCYEFYIVYTKGTAAYTSNV